MKLGIMQPYFIPYLGYWQLLNAVDKYVVYDDVNFIKGGWVNRNRILLNGEPRYINIQMEGASANKLINEIGVTDNKKIFNKELRVIEAAYYKAPNFEEGYSMMKELFECGETNLASFLFLSIQKICEYLGVETEIILSSKMDKDCTLKGQDKVISICKLLNADTYYNAIGGKELYSKEAFIKEGIELKFLRCGNISYKQAGDGFVPNLSILDVIMFNSREEISALLGEYELI